MSAETSTGVVSRIGEVRRGRETATRTGAAWALLALAGIAFAADLGVWNFSIHMTSVANATLFSNFTPLVVTPVAWLLFGEQIGVNPAHVVTVRQHG